MKPTPTLLRLVFIGLILVMATARTDAQVAKGASRAEVIETLGWPTSKSTSENREILTYPECNVLLENGKVVKLEFKTTESRGRLWNRLNKASQTTAPAPDPIQVSPIAASPTPVRNPAPSPRPQRIARPPPPPRPDSWLQFGTNGLLLTVSFFAAVAILLYVNRKRIRSDMLRECSLKQRNDRASAHSSSGIEAPARPDRKPDPILDGWSLALLRELEWRRFEEVVAEYERLLGNQLRLGAIGPDGGIDIHVIDSASGRVSRLIQCKAHGSLVKVDAVRAFYGVMHSEKVERGTFYATDGFPNVAKEFVVGKDLELIDGEMFVARIRQLELPVQIRLFNFAIEGDYKSATCIRCTKKMVLATNRENRRYWRCRCGNMLNARAE